MEVFAKVIVIILLIGLAYISATEDLDSLEKVKNKQDPFSS